MRRLEHSRSESATVKAALKKAGFQVVSVGHGRGTACGWIEIKLMGTANVHVHDWDKGILPSECLACQLDRAHELAALHVAQAVTGRHGEHDGCINVTSFTKIPSDRMRGGEPDERPLPFVSESERKL